MRDGVGPSAPNLARRRPPVTKRARQAARAREVADREQRVLDARHAQRQRAAARKRTAHLASLDAVPPPDGPSVKSDQVQRSRRVPALVAIVLALAAGVGAWAVLRSPDNEPVPGPMAAADPDGSSGATPEQGSSVQAEIVPDGTLRTEHSLAAAGDSISGLVLTLPEQPTGASGLAPAVFELEVRADGSVVRGTPDALSAGETQTVVLPVPARTVELDFRTEGVANRAAESIPGRALVLLNALQVRVTAEDPGPSEPSEEIVAVSQEGVLALACASAKRLQLQPCGAKDGGTWTVVTSSDSWVVAQVDLPDT